MPIKLRLADDTPLRPRRHNRDISTYIRAKIYKIDSNQEELLDYERIVEIIRRADFNGNLSIVFEGHDNQCSDQEAIALAVKYLRKLLAS